MGGFGSGGYNVIKSNLDNKYPRLDSFIFNKTIPMMCDEDIEAQKTTVEWNNGDKINLILYQDKMELFYNSRKNYSNLRVNIKDEIYFSKQSNTYGGTRYYFVCPNCNNCFRFLYCRNCYFKCRHCNRLNYPICRKSKKDIPPLRMQKILSNKFRIDTKGISYKAMAMYLPEKPKGLHWDTYYIRIEELEKAQNEYKKGRYK